MPKSLLKPCSFHGRAPNLDAVFLLNPSTSLIRYCHSLQLPAAFMGKLLQKIVNVVMPSWLARVKSSAPSATKRLLPPTTTDIHDHDRAGSSSDNAMLAPMPASAESPVLPCSIDMVTPPAMLLKETISKQKASDKHEHCDDSDDDGGHGQLKVKHKRSHSWAKRDVWHAEEEQERYLDLLGLKRKRTYSEECKEEEEEEVGKGEGHRSREEWKRRKREEGLMNCELPRRVCKVVGNGKAVVKYSQEPQQALWESMVEMIVGNGLWELESLEFLLFCYLSLNEPNLYSIIQSSFLQVLKDLGRTIL